MNIIINKYLILLIILPLVLNIFGILINKIIQNVSPFLNIIASLILPITLLFLTKMNNINIDDQMDLIITNDLVSNIRIHLKTSLLGNLFTILIVTLYPLTTLYSIGYLRTKYKKYDHPIFHFFISLSVVITLCIALSGNLFTTFIFYELLSLSTYLLIVVKKTEKIQRSAFIYLTLLLIPSFLFFLPGISYIYNITGTLDFQNNGILNGIPLSQNAVNILFGLILFGVAKIAILPFNGWLIYAMVAESPISGLLHAVLVVKSGIFIIFQITIYIFGIDFLKSELYKIYNIQWPIYICSLTILFGAISSILSDNIKKRLAYSTISHLSYILITIFYFTENSIKSGMILFLSHSIAKLLLFFYIGLLYVKYNIVYIKDLEKKNSESNFLLTFSIIIAIFSMIGMPPTIGFIGKYNLVLSTLKYAEDLLIFVVILTSTLMSISYLIPIAYYSIFKKNNTSDKFQFILADFLMNSVIFVLSIAIIMLFFYFEYQKPFTQIKFIS